MAMVSRVEASTPRSSNPGKPGVTWSDRNSCEQNRQVCKEMSLPVVSHPRTFRPSRFVIYFYCPLQDCPNMSCFADWYSKFINSYPIKHVSCETRTPNALLHTPGYKTAKQNATLRKVHVESSNDSDYRAVKEHMLNFQGREDKPWGRSHCNTGVQVFPRPPLGSPYLSARIFLALGSSTTLRM